MLYDLNVPWYSTTTDPSILQNTLSFLTSLGYDTLALNHQSSSPPASQIINPLPPSKSFNLPSTTTLLSRCTLTISDPSINHRLPLLATKYDLLALRPTTEKAYLATCNTLTEHSLISLDLTIRYPFHFKPKPLMTAINRGIRFEICYSQALSPDPSSRRNFISNSMAIIRGTRGRGIVVSSEARDVLSARAPADVLNLLGVWGLARERGKESLGVNPRGVVVNEGLKRRGFRGMVDVIDGGEDIAVPAATQSADENGKKAKRKAEEKAPTDNAIPIISKRAEKRAKLLAKQTQNAEESPAQASNPTPTSTAGTGDKSDISVKISTQKNG